MDWFLCERDLLHERVNARRGKYLKSNHFENGKISRKKESQRQTRIQNYVKYLR